MGPTTVSWRPRRLRGTRAAARSLVRGAPRGSGAASASDGTTIAARWASSHRQGAPGQSARRRDRRRRRRLPPRARDGRRCAGRAPAGRSSVPPRARWSRDRRRLRPRSSPGPGGALQPEAKPRLAPTRGGLGSSPDERQLEPARVDLRAERGERVGALPRVVRPADGRHADRPVAERLALRRRVEDRGVGGVADHDRGGELDAEPTVCVKAETGTGARWRAPAPRSSRRSGDRCRGRSRGRGRSGRPPVDHRPSRRAKRSARRSKLKELKRQRSVAPEITLCSTLRPRRPSSAARARTNWCPPRGRWRVLVEDREVRAPGTRGAYVTERLEPGADALERRARMHDRGSRLRP